MEKLIARVRVVITALPTYLVAIAFVVGVVRDEVAKALPDHPVTEWLTWAAGIVLGVLGVAVVIIRRVTPVIAAQRGLLPPPDGAPVIAEANIGDRGATTTEIALLVCAVCLVILVVLAL